MNGTTRVPIDIYPSPAQDITPGRPRLRAFDRVLTAHTKKTRWPICVAYLRALPQGRRQAACADRLQMLVATWCPARRDDRRAE